MNRRATPTRLLIFLLFATFVGCGPKTPAGDASSSAATERAGSASSGPGKGNRAQHSETAPDAYVGSPAAVAGIGAVAPTTLLDASPSGDWVALCQAREDTDADGKLRVRVSGHGEAAGDRLKPFFVERGGEGFAIDAFVGGDPTGRFVAFVQKGHLVLRDIHAQLETDLSLTGADVRGDLLSYAPHRAGHFHPDGGLFVYLRQAGKRSTAVIRELSSGRETLVDAGEGNLWRAEFEPDGAYLHLRIVTRDTTGDAKLRWPVPVAERASCGLPVPRFVVGEVEPDRVSHLLYRLADGKLSERSGFVMAVGEHLLTRNEKSELWLEAPDATRRMVSGKECLGRVLHVVGPSASVLFGCTSEYGQRRRLELSTRERTLKLGYEVAAFESDGRYPEAPRHLVLNPGNESILVDVVTGRVTALTPGTTLIASHGGSLLVERANKLFWLGSEGTEQDAGFRRPGLSRVIHRGRYVTVGVAWFDLELGMGPVEMGSAPVALAKNGRVLLASLPGSGSDLGNGPLDWVAPQASR
jgi:hypothetical protein